MRTHTHTPSYVGMTLLFSTEEAKGWDGEETRSATTAAATGSANANAASSATTATAETELTAPKCA